MSLNYDKFYVYLEDLNMNYEKLCSLLREKIKAVEVNDLAELEEIMKEEQIYLLISKGFDKNISDFRQTFGLKGEKLSEIIEEIPGEWKEKFTGIYSRLKESTGEAKSLNESCQVMIEAKLQFVNKKLREIDKSRNANYSAAAKPGEPGSHIFSKSI